MGNGEKSGRGRRSRKRSKRSKREKALAKLAEQERIENEVHSLLPDNRKVVRCEAKKLFEEEDLDCITDRTPETPYNSDKELDEEALKQSHELDQNNLLAALNKVESNANDETKGEQSAYEPIDNAKLQTAIPLIPFPPPPTKCPPLPSKIDNAILQTAIPLIPFPPPSSNCPRLPSKIDNATLQTAIPLLPFAPTTNLRPLTSKFSPGAVAHPPDVMSVLPSDSKSSLSSKTGDVRSFSYSSSLGDSSVTSLTSSSSASTTSLHSQTGSMVPPSMNGSLSISDVSIASKTGISLPSSASNTSLKSETGSMVPTSLNGSPSPSDISIASKTGISLPSSVSNISLKSETGSNVSGIWPSDDRTDSTTDRSEKISVVGIPSPSASSTSLVSQTFSPMTSSNASSSLVSQTMSPLKESTMQESSVKVKSPQVPVLVLPSHPSSVSSTSTTSLSIVSHTGATSSPINLKMPVDGHTSSIRSTKESPGTRKDLPPSSQTPVRERPQDFSHRSQTLPKDSSLYQPSGRFNSKGEFLPGDQTLDDVPDIPSEKSDQEGQESPPLRTATEALSSTSLALNSSVVPDKIYGDVEEDEIGAKSDKQFVGKMTLKKNKKNEAGFEFEPTESRGRSRPLTPRKLKVTTVFGGSNRKFVPPVRKKRSPQPATVPPRPPLPDDSRVQLTTVTSASRADRSVVTDRATAPSLPLSLTKKSDRVDSFSSLSTGPTPIHLLRTETSLLPSASSSSLLPSASSSSLLPSIVQSPTPTTSPAALSPVVKKERERPLLSPLATSPVLPKRKSKKRREQKGKSRRSEHKNTPQERVVYRETPVLPTIGTPNRQRKIGQKKRDTEDQSKKEREPTKKSDQKKSNARVARDASDQTSGPIYQQLVYSSYITNGLNVACYNYDEREAQRKKAATQ